jgi:hypothetical protein
MRSGLVQERVLRRSRLVVTFQRLWARSTHFIGDLPDVFYSFFERLVLLETQELALVTTRNIPYY